MTEKGLDGTLIKGIEERLNLKCPTCGQTGAHFCPGPTPSIRNDNVWSSDRKKAGCLHAACPRCSGTGVDGRGHACIHALSCSCTFCAAY